ncbi:MAG: tetratricopeptide repeat protein [Phycisphaerae bacterium]|nr:tetratricopeptide repeat protein [Phycisphaerae bacterium]
MVVRSGRMLLAGIVCAWLVPALHADEKEDPYPYGKAELEAERINDVLELTRRADRYRAESVRRFAQGESLERIEHFGREAKNWYRAVLTREPASGYASLSIGYIDLILGRAASSPAAKDNYFSAAMSRFREALERRPGYAEAHLYMAQVHALRQEYAEAEKNLRLILNSGIENSHVHSWMAYVLFQTKQAAEARTHVARAIELDNPSPAAQWSRQHQRTVAAGK